MNKRTISTSLAALCGALVFAMPALAQTTPPETTTQATTTASTTQATPATQAKLAKQDRAVPAPGSRNCLQSTGSLIPPPKGQCLPVAGNSYSQQDLQRTGAPDVARALQMLDPSIRVYGH